MSKDTLRPIVGNTERGAISRADFEYHPLGEAILKVRRRAAGDFSPEFSGNRGADFDRGLLAAYDAVFEAFSSTASVDALINNLRQRIDRVIEFSGHGFWYTCSGCHESEDGYPNGHYSRSAVLGCTLGSGCSECGGIGAVWDGTDYEDMARWMREGCPEEKPPFNRYSGVDEAIAECKKMLGSTFDIRRILAEIAAQSAPGWVIVPIEPTPDMYAAADKVDWSNEDERATVINLWQAMTGSAPIPGAHP